MMLRSGAIVMERDPKLAADRKVLLDWVARARRTQDEIRRLTEHMQLLQNQLANQEKCIHQIVQAADNAKLSEDELKFLLGRIRPEVMVAVANCIEREEKGKEKNA